MQRVLTILPKIYMGAIALAFAAVMLAQLHIDYSFNEAIITTNYYALVVSSIVFALLAALCYNNKFHLTRGDLATIALAIFATTNSHDGLQTIEVVMSLSYTTLYLSLRLVHSRFARFDRYATTAILLLGIGQSITVLRQVYGFEISTNHNFLVSGDFFNPGPCGIFLAGVLVLALTIIKRDNQCKRLFIIDYVQYYTSYAAMMVSFVAIIPTLSRAGWLGAAVGVVVLYGNEFRRLISSLCRRFGLNIKIVAPALVSICLLSCIGVYCLKKESADGRLFVWQNTISAAMKSPIFGVGVGEFAQYYANAQTQYFEEHNALEVDDPNTAVVGVPAYPFNEGLSLLLAMGGVGLVIALYILYRRMFRCKNRYSAVVIAIVVASLFSYTFYIPLIAIIFIYALSSGQECACVKKKMYNVVLIIPVTLLFISQIHICDNISAEKEWREISMFYDMEDYETVVEDSRPLLSRLNRQDRFMFEYGHSLNKAGRYNESNKILAQGAELSTDPMFWNIIGNNYVSLGDYDRGAKSYLRAYYQCPNRLYPLFLLIKLYKAKGDFAMVKYYGELLLVKKPKVPSLAVDDMRREVQLILLDVE